ncbi:MAG: hypothetical protein R2737_04885 [Candidatus Nanopelagicales bacterium]
MSALARPLPDADRRGRDRSTRPSGRRRRLSLVAPLSVAPPVRAGRGAFVVLVCLILAVGLIGLLVINTSLAQGAFVVGELRQQQAALGEQEQKLAQAVEADAAPLRLQRAAKALGMVPSVTPVFLRLEDGKVLGRPEAAAGVPAPTPGVPSADPADAADAAAAPVEAAEAEAAGDPAAAEGGAAAAGAAAATVGEAGPGDTVDAAPGEATAGAGAAADGAAGDGAASDGAAGDGAASGGAAGDGAVSDGAVSDGAVSDGAVSDGAVSDGAVSDGAVSDGVAAPAGSVNDGVAR